MDTCCCGVHGTNGCWYIDVYGEYRCSACDKVLSQEDEEKVESFVENAKTALTFVND